MTPLHWAAQYGHFEICHLILKNIQDKNPENIHGHTPLTLAAKFGHFETFKLLFDNVQEKNSIIVRLTRLQLEGKLGDTHIEDYINFALNTN